MKMDSKMALQGRPVCLTIGGSDSCGGAGIQADLRTFAAMGVYGCSVITALTAQNPRAITRIEPVSLAQLDAELHAIFDYFDVAAVKTGMLLDAEHIAVVSAVLQQHHRGALIVDPVMVASSGARLLDAGAVDTLVHALLPLATMVTPNLDEAAVLLGETVTDQEEAARRLAGRFGCAVLLKGGHAEESDMLLDVLCDADGQLHRYRHARQPWGEVQAHGTGCRLASLVTAAMAAGLAPEQAVAAAAERFQGL
ncbi:bifunctional hydroxymethylpyrimidine kinase/phosphomethylpyrimidine kinase [Mariprofundus erugo]|uniref:bifunctional hydroxymethylpyrimidine kinase/phosphomethylpyrimidine kinase n=1 Tax=Mariprofundus erugo TaxID=2528639 RepID=UPI001EE90678|nr:bifunctional hydroxymethylpyrimidine kinase/phosphomethylpyrimidine kinase [Mariprofundus erugo]